MNPFKWLANYIRVVSPPGLCCSDQQGFVLVEILPREIVNVVVHTKAQPYPGTRIDDTFGYETMDDAISDVQAVGFRLLGYVEPENLFFVFSESVEALQRFLYGFLTKNRVPFSPDDLFAPISKAQCDAHNKRQPKPRALILCKVRDAKVFQSPIWAEQEKGGEYGNYHEVSWCEVQKLQEHAKDAVPHEVLPSSPYLGR